MINNQKKILAVTEEVFSPKLVSEWENLWNNSPNSQFFNSPEWFTICNKNFSYEAIKIVTVRHGQQLVGIVPLVLTNYYGFKIWSSIASAYSDMATILVDTNDSEIITAVSQYLENIGSVGIFELSGAQKNAFNSRIAFAVEISDNPHISAENMLDGLSKKSAKRIRTKIRSNGEEVAFNFVNKPQVDILKLIQKVEKQSNKVENFKETFADETVVKLFSSILEQKRIPVAVASMQYNNTTIITDIYVITNNMAHSLHTSYDKEFDHLWPGTTIQYKILEYFNLNLPSVKMIDLGRGINTVKLKFATDTRKQYVLFMIKNPAKRLVLQLITVLIKKLHDIKNASKFLSNLVVTYKKIHSYV